MRKRVAWSLMMALVVAVSAGGFVHFAKREEPNPAAPERPPTESVTTVSLRSPEQWSPVAASTVKFQSEPNIADFDTATTSRIRDSLAFCQRVFEDSENEDDRNCLLDICSVPIRPLDDKFWKNRTNTAFLNGAPPCGTVDFKRGCILLNPGAMKDCIVVALSVMHELGHYRRDDDFTRLQAEKKMAEFFRAESRQFRLELRRAVKMHRWLEANYPDNADRTRWLAHLRKNVPWSIVSAHSCRARLDFCYIASETGSRLERIKAIPKKTPAQAEEFQAASQVHASALPRAEDSNVLTVQGELANLQILLAQLVQLDEAFGADKVSAAEHQSYREEAHERISGFMRILANPVIAEHREKLYELKSLDELLQLFEEDGK